MIEQHTGQGQIDQRNDDQQSRKRPVQAIQPAHAPASPGTAHGMPRATPGAKTTRQPPVEEPAQRQNHHAKACRIAPQKRPGRTEQAPAEVEIVHQPGEIHAGRQVCAGNTGQGHRFGLPRVPVQAPQFAAIEHDPQPAGIPGRQRGHCPAGKPPGAGHAFVVRQRPETIGHGQQPRVAVTQYLIDRRQMVTAGPTDPHPVPAAVVAPPHAGTATGEAALAVDESIEPHLIRLGLVDDPRRHPGCRHARLPQPHTVAVIQHETGQPEHGQPQAGTQPGPAVQAMGRETMAHHLKR